MNILFLCHRIPFPPNKGDKIRSFNELVYLSRKHRVYLGTTLDEESDQAYVKILESYCEEVCAIYFDRKTRLAKSVFSGKPFSVSNFYDSSLQAFVDRVVGERGIDAVICFCSSMAEYVFNNPLYRKAGLSGIKLIMDFVDLDSDKWLQYARYAGRCMSLIYRIENNRLFKYETKINRAFDHSIFVSDREVKVFQKLYPANRNVRVIANGVDYGYFSPHQLPDLERSELKGQFPTLVFTGYMDYFANEDGVRWFCEKIFPMIRAEFPDVEFYIVGNRPTNAVWSLSEIDGVTVTGYVDDIRTYYRMADVCVIPLRIARGLQNKVLEAMATGNAVVATSNASEGIICHQNRDIVIADDEETFAGEVISLLRNEDRRREMSRQAVDNIHRNYSWESNLKCFDEILGDGKEAGIR